MKKLNLGCGEFKKEGYINVDVRDDVSADVVHDLNNTPYPFKDDEFNLVEADHLLEHLQNPLGVLRELHRIIKNEGIVIIRTPHFSRGFTHPDHKRGFDVTLPYYFQPTFRGGYQGVEFRLEKMKLSWFAQKYLKKQTVSPVLYYGALVGGIVLDFFANLSPIFCSRVWCFWVGGFEEIEFRFVCKK